MANETIEKLSSDEAVVKETVVNEEVINVEEMTAKKAGYQAQKEATIAQYDTAIAECDALLEKAKSANVIADGIIGEKAPVVPQEGSVFPDGGETPTIADPETVVANEDPIEVE